MVTADRGNNAGTSSLRRLSTHAFVGNIVYLVSQFGLLTVMTRVTDPMVVGQYAWALAITAPVFLLANLRLQQLQILDTTITFGSFLMQRVMTSGLAALVILAVLTLSGAESEVWQITAAVTGFKFVEGAIDVFYGEMMRRERMWTIAIWQSVRGVGGLIVFSAVLVAVDAVVPALVAMAAFSVVPLLLLARSASALSPRVDWLPSRHQMSRATWLSLPVGLAFFLGSLTVNVPRYVIEFHLGLESLAFFVTAAYVVVLANIVVDSMAQSVVPRLARHFAAGSLVAFTRIVNRVLIAALTLGIVGIVLAATLGRQGLELVFGAEYGAGATALVSLSVAAGFQYWSSVYRVALMAAGRLSVTLPVSMANLVIATIACVALIPRHGLVAAGVGLALGQCASALMYSALFAKLTRGRRSRHTLAD